MLSKIALGLLLLDGADGARVQRRKASTRSTFIAGVPVHNYHLAFDQSRWGNEVQGKSPSLSAGQENWVVMMRPDISEAELQAACSGRSSCSVHGHAGGVPHLELSASEEELSEVLAAGKGNIELVEPDLPMSATPELPATQSDDGVPWGLRRVRSRSLSNMPRGDPGTADGGKGVNVYVLDTGIRTTHSDFGDRAFPAIQLGWFNRITRCNGDRNCALDRQGHGTHCAGTVGGNAYGVAKGAVLHAVKVLSDTGGGSTGGIIAGIDWVASSAQQPAVASMSLGGGFSSALNRAVDQLSATGVTVVTAAGNNNDDACIFSPGSAASAINIGSTDPSDQRSSFSMYGECLDLWAPGRAVLSASPESDTSSRTLSGTSMACPHVSGAAAILLQATPTLKPAEVKARLLQAATPDVVTGIPTYPASSNLLLYLAE